jgi:hypothetical protein
MCPKLVGVVFAVIGLANMVEGAAPPPETLDSLR